MRKWISKVSRSLRTTSASANASSAIKVENLEDRRLCSGTYAYGINANSGSASQVDAVIGMLRNTGTKSVRLWLSTNFSKTETGIFKYIRKYSSAGFDITLSVVPSGKASYGTVESYFNWLGGALGGSVDRFAIGNEPDREQWRGNLDGYVTDLLAPAAEGLHARGEKVVSAGVSWNPEDEATMVRAGMLKHVDYVGYHPYAKSVSMLKDNVAKVKALAGGKPLVATEWNVRGLEGNSGAWADAIGDYWPTIRDNFYAAYYYAAVKSGTMAGAAGVLTSGGSPNGAFYSAYKNLKSGGGDGTVDPIPQPPTVPQTPTTPTTPTPGTNTPSTAGAPSIGSFRIYDATTGAVLKGYENVTSSTTIKLADLKGHKIQIQASASSSTSSVKFTFSGRTTRVENTAAWTVFGNSSNAEQPWQPKAGSFNLSAQGFSLDNARGTAGRTLSLVLKFV